MQAARVNLQKLISSYPKVVYRDFLQVAQEYVIILQLKTLPEALNSKSTSIVMEPIWDNTSFDKRVPEKLIFKQKMIPLFWPSFASLNMMDITRCIGLGIFPLGLTSAPIAVDGTIMTSSGFWNHDYSTRAFTYLMGQFKKANTDNITSEYKQSEIDWQRKVDQEISSIKKVEPARALLLTLILYQIVHEQGIRYSKSTIIDSLGNIAPLTLSLILNDVKKTDHFNYGKYVADVLRPHLVPWNNSDHSPQGSRYWDDTLELFSKIINQQ